MSEAHECRVGVNSKIICVDPHPGSHRFALLADPPRKGEGEERALRIDQC